MTTDRERMRERTAEITRQDEELRSAYETCFRSRAGKRVLEDLIERFDPVLNEVPPNGDAALWLTAVRRVMSHIRENTGGHYASAMGRVDERSRR